MKALKYLNQYLWKYKWYLILGTIFTIISNLFGIIPAQLVRYALDLVVETLDIYYLFNGAALQTEMYDIFAFSILLYGLLILAMALLKGIFLFLVRQTIIVMSRHIEFALKNDIYQHYQTLPASFFRRHSTGDLMARISEDVSNVRMYVGPALMYGINLIVLFFLVISYMLSVSTKLTLYVLLPLPVLSISVYIVNSMIMKRSQEIQKQLSGLSTYVQEAFSGIRVIKSFVQEKHSFNNFQKEAEDFKNKSLSLTKVDAFFYPVIVLLIGLSNILVIYVGGQEIINGNLTPGNITEFILYVNMLTWPVMALGWTTSQIQRAASSQTRINEFLNEKTTLVSTKNIEKPLEGAITFKHVGFTYPDSGIKALHDFDLEVKQGESIAILGTTGSGKSTLAHLLCRLYDPTEGEILIDNIPMKDYDVHAYRRQIGYVPQDVFLFSDSIENNVRFGTTDMPFERIEQAVKDADLYNNIVDFPQGYQTLLGERGITLSGGQKQRLSIARAIARDPKILVLDDCLSAVDTNTENIILNNLKRIMDQRTSVIISHRVSSAKLADRIVVLDEGKIVEQGTHTELMALNKAYKELYEKQLVAEEA
ncbi:ABC transporter ATP-binding protein [Dyadobacter fanqingshengii]|uniref:ABC transporter ATP-binding protein/permease n=1 Tax=Dyadobacter fanqingshengii TaxID=2906443 RepID=A0A9X1T869_9BACT|nr:ABC transporter ATP-binding protein [Dyadobacter fanqingshengii]MCF0039411.1 ABC transporter ATP-binding protein/permease [Dyadobacter fanqingshengii]MCF2503047.1 ABC transporter ATP-binding protein/permease [Dyadobacter fanqingshengii]USJ33776.1 ABC transporter ATP-binding protein/permease [Dyadobacter fanqingshengii]